MTINNLFDLTGKVAVITGAGGILGPKHAEAIIEYGGVAVLTDSHEDRAAAKAKILNEKYGEGSALSFYMDVTKKDTIEKVAASLKKVDILINNAAKDPKVEDGKGMTPSSRFETMTEEFWQEGISAALHGTFLCSQVFGNKMLETGGGTIVNIASCLANIAPDQRIYRQEGIEENMQNVKPITYVASKWAVVGMTKYLATYFGTRNIRVNSLSPTGVWNDKIPDFMVERIASLNPMNRMAHIDEYKGAIVFLCSDASSYMTGTNMIVDGGKTSW
jgi:NAD(P)-dependent dehydrogenase (short-subunit alcohol dehydrogenase family)|tara:strand:- start:263 stop:1087 length:825 start_codon:yes stop_codon:yes gene_type:complete